jgi:hypothetical protein
MLVRQIIFWFQSGVKLEAKSKAADFLIGNPTTGVVDSN